MRARRITPLRLAKLFAIRWSASASPTIPCSIEFDIFRLPFVERLFRNHGRVGVKRKLDFGAVRSAFDPELDVGNRAMSVRCHRQTSSARSVELRQTALV
jgi:hypothetical protein